MAATQIQQHVNDGIRSADHARCLFSAKKPHDSYQHHDENEDRNPGGNLISLVCCAGLERDIGQGDNKGFAEDSDNANIRVEEMPMPNGMEESGKGIRVRSEKDAVCGFGAAVE